MVHRLKDNHLDEILALVCEAHKLAMADGEKFIAYVLQMAILETNNRVEKTSEEQS
jgi:hypothetical protein